MAAAIGAGLTQDGRAEAGQRQSTGRLPPPDTSHASDRLSAQPSARR